MNVGVTAKYLVFAGAEGSNHVRSHDFAQDRTREGREFDLVCVIGGFTRAALAIFVKGRLDAMDARDGACGTFDSKLRGERRNREIIHGLAEARPAAGSQTH